MMELTPSQWVIIPLLILTNLVVTVSLIGLLFGPFFVAFFDLIRGKRRPAGL